MLPTTVQTRTVIFSANKTHTQKWDIFRRQKKPKNGGRTPLGPEDQELRNIYPLSINIYCFVIYIYIYIYIIDIELRRRLWITLAPSLDLPAAALDHPAPLWITPPPPSDIEPRSKENHVLRRDIDIELRRRLWTRRRLLILSSVVKKLLF